jgi:hypothetical protein
MKRTMWMAIGLCSSLAVATSAAAFGEEAGIDGSAGSAKAENGSSGMADTSEEKDASQGSGNRSHTRGTSAVQPKPADTGTAAGYIHDQVQKGNIKIEGAIDGDDWD